jgi:hypothetical protein
MKRLFALARLAAALCCVLLTAMGSSLLAQSTGSVDPRAAPVEPSVKQDDPPPGGCMPIGLTVSGEVVFPFQCKEFIERLKARDQKAAVGEEKPAAAQEEPGALQQKPAAEEKPAATEEKPPAVKEETTAAKRPNTVAPESISSLTELLTIARRLYERRHSGIVVPYKMVDSRHTEGDCIKMQGGGRETTRAAK